ncbi:DUF2683 domain-containing protein [Candidatus Parvarchaeota archaeon]|nr:DUF2683 domain-containing protein [Candidatus Parvarchaeota archaeon]
MGSATLNLQVDDYTNRVLGVIKETFGLRDKSQALKKFADMFGEQFVHKEISDEVAKEIINDSEAHIKKYGFRKMSFADIDKLVQG